MKLKQMNKYVFSEGMNFLLYYYLVLLVATAVLVALNLMEQNGVAYVGVTLFGLQFTSAVVLLVLGIVLFWLITKSGLANSVSRKTIFKSLVMVGLALAVITALVDVSIGAAAELITGEEMGSIASYERFYDPYAPAGTTYSVLAVVGTYVVLGCLGMFLGYAIGALYYRMNTWQTVLVSVGVPLLYFAVITPIIMNVHFPTDEHSMFHSLELLALDIGSSPLYVMLVNLLLTALLILALWLLIRRAPVRAK